MSILGDFSVFCFYIWFLDIFYFDISRANQIKNRMYRVACSYAKFHFTNRSDTERECSTCDGICLEAFQRVGGSLGERLTWISKGRRFESP